MPECLVCPSCESPNVVVLWLKCEDCGEVTARDHAEPYARPKRDRRHEPRQRSAWIGERPDDRLLSGGASALLSSVMPFTPPGAVLLDVTLRLGDEVRRWTITSELGGWSCRLVTTNSVTVSRCEDGEAVRTQEREWRAEIEVARAAGWS